MPRPLLPSGYAREDTRSNAIQRPENDIISPIGGVALYYIEIDNWPSSKCYKDSYIIPKSFSHIRKEQRELSIVLCYIEFCCWILCNTLRQGPLEKKVRAVFI